LNLSLPTTLECQSFGKFGEGRGAETPSVAAINVAVHGVFRLALYAPHSLKMTLKG